MRMAVAEIIDYKAWRLQDRVGFRRNILKAYGDTEEPNINIENAKIISDCCVTSGTASVVMAIMLINYAGLILK